MDVLKGPDTRLAIWLQSDFFIVPVAAAAKKHRATKKPFPKAHNGIKEISIIGWQDSADLKCDSEEIFLLQIFQFLGLEPFYKISRKGFNPFVLVTAICELILIG